MTQQELAKRLEEAKLIRSRRKTISIEVQPEGNLVIRAPRFSPTFEIQHFVRKNLNWIVKKMDQADAKNREREEHPILPFTQEEIEQLADEALRVLPPRIKAYAEQMGVTYGRVTIRNQKTRWGSCTAKGNLNFNCLLMLTPESVQNYVLVHELAHRREMNHSSRFWAIVESVLPDYKESRRWLQKEGEALIERLR